MPWLLTRVWAPKAIAVQTPKGVFVGPDNRVLSWALAKEKITAEYA